MKNIFSDTKCKYESYDKNEIDALLSNIYTKGDFAVVTSTISFTEGTGDVQINYPTGFNKDNTEILNTALKIANIWQYTTPNNAFNLCASLRNDYIKLAMKPIISTTATGSYDCKVILLKVDVED